MADRSRPLDTLHELRARSEHQAKAALSQALAVREQAAAELQAAELARQGAQASLAAARQQRSQPRPRSAAELAGMGAHERRLEAAVAERTQMLAAARTGLTRAERELGEAREALAAAARERAVLERHQDKVGIKEARERERGDEAARDDAPKK